MSHIRLKPPRPEGGLTEDQILDEMSQGKFVDLRGQQPQLGVGYQAEARKLGISDAEMIARLIGVRSGLRGLSFRSWVVLVLVAGLAALLALIVLRMIGWWP